MKSYRMVWAGAWALALVPLCFLGMVLGEPAVVLILSGLAAALVVALVERKHHRRWWLEAALAVGGFSAATYAVGPLAAGGVVFLVAVTSPPVAAALTRALLHERARGTRSTLSGSRVDELRDGAPLGPEAFAGMVRLLDDRELVAAWRQSHDVLGYTNLPELRTQLVSLRQAYLDEMERRDPVGFAAWMEDGATRAPERFLAPGRARELE